MATRLFRAAPAEPSDFEKARARWEFVSQRRRELNAKLDGAQAALSLASNPPSAGEPRSAIVAEKAATYLAGRIPSVARLQGDVTTIEHELDDASASYAVEAAAWRQAVAEEGARRAATFRPRQAAAAARIAALIERLSGEIEAARALQAEMSEVGAITVDLGQGLGTLHEYHSPLSVWGRHARTAGLIA